MRGLTLWQPWASAIAFGAKRIETRSWGTAYTGPILICSALRTPVVEFEFSLDDDHIAAALLSQKVLEQTDPMPLPGAREALKRLPHGCALAVATLAGTFEIISCEPHYEGASGTPFEGGAAWTRLTLRAPGGAVRTHDINATEKSFGNYTPRRFAWLLDDVRPLVAPLPCRGAQGLWKVDGTLKAAVVDDLGPIGGAL